MGQPVRVELTIAEPQSAVLPLHYGKHLVGRAGFSPTSPDSAPALFVADDQPA